MAKKFSEQDARLFLANIEKLTDTPDEKAMFAALKATSTDYVFFGGVIRDYFFSQLTHISRMPRDIDIVVETDHFEDFVIRFQTNLLRRNRFGGARFRFGTNIYDIWTLDHTWAYQNYISKNNLSLLSNQHGSSLEVLPRLSFFNVNAIVFSPRSNRFIEHEFTKCMKTRVLDIVYEPNLFPELCVINATALCARFGLKPSKPLANFVVSNWRSYHSRIQAAIDSHYESPEITMAQVDKFMNSSKHELQKPRHRLTRSAKSTSPRRASDH